MSTHQARSARLREFFAQDPHNPDLACDLADALFASGDVIDARSVLNSLPTEAATAPGVRFRLARCALATGEYADAAAIHASMLHEGLDGVALRHDLAFAQLCMQRPDEAMHTLVEAVEAFGPTPELLILKSRIALMQADFATAVASADEALAMRPGDPIAFGVKALAQFDGNEQDASAYTARAALEIDPDQHEALLVAATLCLWQQDVDTAQPMFERALARHPNSGRALSGYGQLLMLRNELPRAGEVLDHATRTMPSHIGTWHALAWCQLLMGRIDDAEASYRSAYEVDRNFGDTHGGLALIAALRGHHDEADMSIRRALRLDPNAATARYAQALLMEARGDAAGSEAQIAKLLPQAGIFASMPVSEFAHRLKSTLTSGNR
jgi:Tfp pilus assembly protein PilF